MAMAIGTAVSVFGQNGFSYQAVIRDAEGVLVTNKQVEVKFSLKHDGTVYYSEKQEVRTNEYGNIQVVVGGGERLDGDFASVPWSTFDIKMEVAVDIDGKGEVVLGEVPVQGAPYAMYAQKAGGLTSKNANTKDGEALFAVNDASGNPVFAVFADGIVVYVDDTDAKAKRSGFVVTGRSATKGESATDYFSVTAEGTQIYVDDVAESQADKAKRSGFVVTGRSATKDGPADYLTIDGKGTTVYVEDDSSKAKRSGFVVTGRSATKDGLEPQYFAAGADGTTVYVDDTSSDKAKRSGFVVTGRTATKGGDADGYLAVDGSGTQVYVDGADADDKARRSGFVVTGRTASKAEEDTLFAIAGGYTRVYVDEDEADKAKRSGFVVTGRTASKDNTDLFNVSGGGSVEITTNEFAVNDGADDTQETDTSSVEPQPGDTASTPEPVVQKPKSLFTVSSGNVQVGTEMVMMGEVAKKIEADTISVDTVEAEMPVIARIVDRADTVSCAAYKPFIYGGESDSEGYALLGIYSKGTLAKVSATDTRRNTVLLIDADGNVTKRQKYATVAVLMPEGDTQIYIRPLKATSQTISFGLMRKNAAEPYQYIKVEAEIEASAGVPYKIGTSSNYGGRIVIDGTVAYGDQPTFEPEPMTGYKFVRWSDGSTRAKRTFTILDDFEISAEFERMSYVVAVKSDNERFGTVTGSGSGTYWHGDTLRVEAEPATGYYFSNWSGAELGDSQQSSSLALEVTSKLKLIAHFGVKQYTITFDTDGGSEIEPAVVYYQDKVTAPAEPQREGYRFLDWEPRLPKEMPAEDLTVKATWSVKQFLITFDTDGGTPVDIIDANYGEAVEKPADPEREGYTFAGWSDSIPAVMPARDLRIKTLWTVNQYTIKFETDGGSAVDSITTDYGTTVVAPEEPTKEGYTFAGWKPEVPAMMPANGTTCTAQWTVNEYELTWDANGGTFENGKADSVVTVAYGAAVSAPSTAPGRTGYTFAGWKLDGTDEVPAMMPAKATNILAQWTVNEYELTWDANGGAFENGKADSVVTVAYGAKVLAPSTAPGRTGYAFAGWKLDGTDEVPAMMLAKATNILAQWTVNQYMLTYMVDGKQDGETETLDYGQKITLREVETREGYTFSGWKLNGKDELPQTMPDSNVVLTGLWTANDIAYTVEHWQEGLDGKYVIVKTLTDTLTGKAGAQTDAKAKAMTGFEAQTFSNEAIGTADYRTAVVIRYKRLSYQLTWNANGGTIDGKNERIDSLLFGAPIVAPTVVREGYECSGWGGLNVETMPASDLSVVALWGAGEVTYTVEHKGEGTDGGYIALASQTLTGVTGSQTAAAAKEFTGFAAPESIEQQTIAADGTTTVTIIYKQNSYRLIWDANGGTINGKAADTVPVGYGVAISRPAEPSQKGYTFLGWEPEVPATMPAKDTAFHAKWDTLTYTISFKDTAGSTFAMANPIEYTVNDEIVIENPEKAGYTFLGWTGGKWETATQNIVIKNDVGDFELKANWSANVVGYTVRHNFEDLQGGYSIVESEPSSGATDDWTAAAAMTRTGFTLRESIVQQRIKADESTIIDIYYIRDSYTLTWKDGDETIDSEDIKFEATVTMHSSLTRDGYTFKGWSDTLTTMPAASTTLTAVWAINQYTITFESNDGSAVDAITADYDAAVTAPTDPTRTGYTFKGWATTATATADDVVAIASKMPVDGATYYAVWAINQYTITFNSNGGSAVASITADYDAAVTAPADPTRTGYTFKGWATTATATADDVVTIASKMPVGGATYFAVWAINQYTIAVTAANGTVSGTGDYEHGQTVELTATADAHYHFVNWNGKNELTNPTISFTATKDSSLTANFAIDQFTVNFGPANGEGGTVTAKVNGNNITSGSKVDYNTDVTLTATPESGYFFIRWSDGETANTRTITKDTTINAVFKNEILVGDSLVYTLTSATEVSVGKGSRKPTGELTIPATVTDAYGDQFSVTGISYNGFGSCSDLTSVSLPESVTIIKSSAFFNCRNLASINIPDNVTSIEESAFSNCTKLTEINIPDKVRYIAYEAFSSCDGLTSVTIPASVVEIGCGAFSSCTKLTSITVAEGNDNYVDIDGVVYTIDTTMLVQYPAGKTDTLYIVHNKVKTIGCDAFYRSKLKHVAIPSGVEKIEESAFYGSSKLKTITLPSSCNTVKSTLNYGDTIYCQAATAPENVPSSNAKLNCKAIKIKSADETMGTAKILSAGGYGADGSTWIAAGDPITLQATPKGESYELDKFTVNGEEIGNPYTVTEDATITAVFKMKSFTVTATVNSAAMGTVTGGGSVEYGSDVTLTATAIDPYEFKEWNDGNTQNPRTLTNVTAAMEIQAIFKGKDFTLSWNTNEGSELSGTYTSGLVEYGTAITAPNAPTRAGYTFKGWATTANATVAETVAQTMPDDDVTYYAVWQRLTSLYVAPTAGSPALGTAEKPFGSIDEALAVMNSKTTDYTININGQLTGNQGLGDTLNTRAKSITLCGLTGTTADSLYGNNSGRVLTISTTVPVTVRNLTISGGNAAGDNGGGIYIATGATLTLADGARVRGNKASRNGTDAETSCGGGVYNAGTLFMYGSAVIGDSTKRVAAPSSTDCSNSAGRGSGLYNQNGATAYLGYSSKTQTAELTGGIFYNYNAGGENIEGSGVFNRGTIKMNSGSIAYNGSISYGAGVLTEGAGIFELSGGKISNNVSTFNGAQGGGVWVTTGSQFIMTGGEISGNSATHGAAVHVSNNGIFTITDGTVRGNKSPSSKSVCFEQGKFNIGGSAVIEDTVRVISDTIITICKKFDNSVNAITLAPDTYATNRTILALADTVTSTTLTAEVGKFKLLQNGATTWYINAEGKLWDGFVQVDGAYFDGSKTISNSGVFIKDRKITIPDLIVSDHEVTQREYEQYLTYYGVVNNDVNHPTSGNGLGDDYPAYYLTWYEAIMYCNLRSLADNLTPVYYLTDNSGEELGGTGNGRNPSSWLDEDVSGTNIAVYNGKYYYNSTVLSERLDYQGSTDENGGIRFDQNANGWRLPTEIEWEYLARGGNLTANNQQKFSGTSSVDEVTNYAWYGANSGAKSHEVRTKLPNALNLYDLSGNVFEWCWDWLGSINAETDLTGASSSSGSQRITRSGGWEHNDTTYITVYHRHNSPARDRYENLGLRIVRNNVRYATVGGVACADLASTIEAIRNATGTTDVILYRGVSKNDLGKAATSNTIINAIKSNNNDDARFNLVVAQNANIDLSNCFNMFNNCKKLVSADLKGFNTENVTDMYGMFNGCSSLTTIDLSSFNTGKVTDMRDMFYGCNSLTTLNLSSFNTSSVTSMEQMFYECRALTTLDLSSFNTSSVTSMRSMFYECRALTTLDLSGFNTGKVTDMALMFYACLSLTTLDLSSFNTSNVTTMSTMFNYCQSLTTLDLSSFNTEKVGNMGSMFYNCSALTTIYAPIGANWNKAGLTSTDMFSGCSKLVGGKGTKCDTSEVKDATRAKIDGGTGNPGYFTEPYAMVGGRAYFDAATTIAAIRYATADSICVVLSGQVSADDLGKAETENSIIGAIKRTAASKVSLVVPEEANIAVTNCKDMFYECSKLVSADLRGFNTSNVEDMSWMFFDCTALATIDLSRFNTVNVTNMYKMFNDCVALTTLDLSSFNTASVTNMSIMFSLCEALTTLDVSSFNTSKVTDMNNMFGGCRLLTTLDVSSFNTENVTNMNCMFGDCSNLTTLDLSSFNTSNVTNMCCIFYNCSALTTIYAAADANWNKESGLASTNMFSGCNKLKGGKGTTYNSNYKDATRAHIDGLNGQPGYFTAKYAVVGGVICSDLTATIDSIGSANDTTEIVLSGAVSAEDLGKASENGTIINAIATNEDARFHLVVPEGANILLSGEDCKEMFNYCQSLVSADLRGFNTSNVTNMSKMFNGCSNLESLNLSGFNTSNVTDMSNLFYNCKKLASIDLTSFNTENVTDMYSMFQVCSSLTTLDVSNFNTGLVTNMCAMFSDCSSLTTLDVSSFNTISVTMTSGMFQGCSSLATIYAASGANWYKESGLSDCMFEDCTKLKGGNGTTFSASDVTAARARVDGLNGQPGYFTLKYATVGGVICKDLASTRTAIGNATANDTIEVVLSGAVSASDLGKASAGTVTINEAIMKSSAYVKLVVPEEANIVLDEDGCKQMFNGCKKLVSADLRGLNTSNVTSMWFMFCGCSALTTVDLSNFNTENVTNMGSMFYCCSSLTSLDLSSFNTGNVTDMSNMFCLSDALTTIYAAPGANWGASAKLTSSSYMFSCKNLKGGNGTAYDHSSRDASYARIDGLDGKPGFFTAKLLSYYVNPATGSTGNTGLSAESPLPSLAAAFAKMNDRTMNYNIFVSGKLTGAQGLGDTLNTRAKSITLTGLNGWSDGVPQDTLDGGFTTQTENGRPLTISTTVPVTVRYLALVGGYNSTNGGGLYAAENSRVTLDSSYVAGNKTAVQGAGIYLAEGSVVTMSSTVIDGNMITEKASNTAGEDVKTCGGGVYVGRSATFDMKSGSIIGNFTTDGSGGVFVRGTFNMYGGTISTNKRTNDVTHQTTSSTYICDVEIDPPGTFNMYGGTITQDENSTLTVWNGAVCLFAASYDSGTATFNMHGGSITKMKQTYRQNSSVYLSGLTNAPCVFNMYGGEITDNLAKTGGALYIGGNSTATLKGGLISGNTATTSGNGVYVNSATAKLILSDSIKFGANDDIYLNFTTSKSKVHLLNTLTAEAPVATISVASSNYSTSTQVLALADGATTSIGDECGKFAMANTSWCVKSNGYLGNVYARVGGITCADLASTVTAIQNATDTVDVVLTSKVTASDLGKAATSGTIINAIKTNEHEDARFNLVVPEGANIALGSDCSNMFYECGKLVSADLRGLNTENVTDMSNMFSSCQSLKTVDVSGFNTQNVTNMRQMFNNCSVLTTLDVSNFNTANVSIMGGMFGRTALITLDLSNFNTENVTEMNTMFANCSELTTIYVAPGADWSGTQNTTHMFAYCTKLVGGNGTTFSSDYGNYALVDGLNGQPGYFSCKLQSYYVNPATGNDSNTGLSAESALQSLASALGKMNDRATYYNIFVSGKLTGAQGLGDTLNTRAKSITLTGLNGWSEGVPQDTLDGGFTTNTENGRPLTISTTVPVTVRYLALVGGYNSTNGGGLYAAENSRVTLDSSYVAGNKTKVQGAGIYLAEGSVVTMSSTVISENEIFSRVNGTETTKTCGGGVYIGRNATFNMKSGSIVRNITTDGGGGVFARGTFNMLDGTISTNYFKYSGTYVTNIDVSPPGTVNMYGGTITIDDDNTYGIKDGVVIVYAGSRDEGAATFNMHGGSITNTNSTSNDVSTSVNKSVVLVLNDNNSATNGCSCDFNMTGGEITGNQRRAVYVGAKISGTATATATLTGGTISGNVDIKNGEGNGVYADAYSKLILSDSIKFGANDNIYLYNSKVLLLNTLTAEAPVATISVASSDYSTSTRVLDLADGATTTIGAECGKFAMSESGWEIDSNGNLSNP